MSHIIKDLTQKGIIQPPRWLPDNVQFLTMTGSVSYGVSGDTSDMDLVGWVIPSREIVFPHLAGEIMGFGRQKQRFDQWQMHHVDVPEHRKEYDFTVYNIVKYFQLCMENNPNMIDSLFVPQFCIQHATHVANMVREKRHIFLHKGCWPKFKGYAYSQLHKTDIKANREVVQSIREFEDKHNIPHSTKWIDVEMAMEGQEGAPKCLANLDPSFLMQYRSMFNAGRSMFKRFESVKEHDTDVKFLYHVVRLLYEAEMILTEHDLDLQRHREHMKSIRRGEISEDDVRKWASEKEASLEKVYTDSKLRHSPDEPLIKQLLIDCLEHHYGSLDKCVTQLGWAESKLKEIDGLLETVRLKLYS